ncbi:MAG: nicotinate-nicotinamide nucleotide adenylyltransferase [Bryobacteraceae bacterium]
MEFYRQISGKPRKVGILAGSFNPPTIAHLELVLAASARVDLMVCVVPRVFPHKEYSGATLDQRVEMLDSAGLAIPHAIAATEQGLFIDIAGEFREHYGAGTELSFICGRDAAERILRWDYGRAGVVEEMLGEFELLVAPRGGHFSPPEEFRHRIHVLNIREGHEEVSSTEVRERIARGEAWEHLVPEKIRERVREIYSCSDVSKKARKR